ncbi:MAG: hypothetical protein ACFBSE_12510 [Prochloraceae cyanobacterium]
MGPILKLENPLAIAPNLEKECILHIETNLDLPPSIVLKRSKSVARVIKKSASIFINICMKGNSSIVPVIYYIRTFSDRGRNC